MPRWLSAPEHARHRTVAASAGAAWTPRRVAMIAVHTSPLEIPGCGDAGGLNVYVAQIARRLASRGIDVDVFTRATRRDVPPQQRLAPGVTVRNVVAGPLEPLPKDELPVHLCAFTAAVLRAEAMREPGWYDVIHSHYWLSGEVGRVASQRWGVPLIHTMHTLAKVKNAALAEGDVPEPGRRVIGEADVVAAADRLVTNTWTEARQLVDLYGAELDRIRVVPPGVDTAIFRPGDAARARRRLGLPIDGCVVLFVGRLQPLKGPDIAVRAAAEFLSTHPGMRSAFRLVIVGGPSGSRSTEPERLRALAADLGVADVVIFAPPMPADRLVEFYRAATVTIVPSHSESFGLVALESQACGTPVVAARVGGLTTAVRDGESGLLVDGHDPARYAWAIGRLLDPGRRAEFVRGAVTHAMRFHWDNTVEGILGVYRDALAERRTLAIQRLASRVG
ncbi:MAG: D-inositol-3-phosphate glycosyltransferase [Acidothermus cellulolyticus]|nr:D-inositol-3-phosphate glycosyltransferase [Acidothermus cellulolyticus]